MSQLLVPVYRGEIEVVRAGQPEKDFVQWGCEKFNIQNTEDNHYPNIANFLDPTSSLFCYHEHFQFLVNKKLKNGYVIVGLEGNGGWLFTKAENTIP